MSITGMHVVMELNSGGKWREIGDMWDEWERSRLGKIVVVEDEDWEGPGIFMLDGSEIFRYDVASNHWRNETSVPSKASDDSSVGFVALDGELHVMTLLTTVDSTETRSSLFIQIYHPGKKAWRSLNSKPPLHSNFDFKTVVMCTIRL